MVTTTADTFSDLIRQRDFMHLWGTRLFGTVGSQMLMVAIGWHMYDLTGRAWDLGLVGLFQFAPVLLLTIWAGHVADRAHRGHVISACMAVQALVAVVLLAGTQGVGASTPWVSRELLLLMSIALGAARAFQQPAQQSLVPMLLPVQMLPRGLAFSSAAQQVATICSPALGGLLYAFGANAVYVVCVTAFGTASFLVWRLRYVHVKRAAEPVSLRTLFAGVAFVWQRKVLLGATSLDLFAVLLGGATALLPMFARDILMTGPLGLGLLRGAPAIGALIMSATLTRWPLRRKVGRKLMLAVSLFGVCMVVFGLSHSFVVSLVALAISGAADMVSVVIRQTLVQIETPNEMRGRVSAVNSVFLGASNQLGEFESGATAALVGPVASVVFGGVSTLLIAALWTRLFPPLAQRDSLSGNDTSQAGKA